MNLKFLKDEFAVFVSSFVFFTVIPLPAFLTERIHNRNALRYFPLIGWVSGALSAALWYISIESGLGVNVSILLAMVASTWITGGLHEDGLADTFDGLGGGHNREAILRIMKDSSIGTYGVLSLLFSKGLLFLLLQEVKVFPIWQIFLISESFSRWMVLLPVMFLRYAREEEHSKAGPVSIHYKKNILSFLIPFLPAALPAAYLLGSSLFSVLILPLFIGIIITLYYKKRLNGYTGDMLGALQQISYIIIVLSIIINIHYGLIY
jgi:adenosylcobinamide-GDP ribazoletransferase